MVLFVLDAFVFNQGVLAAITLMFVLFGFLPKALIAYFKRSSPRYYLKKSLIYAVMAVGVLGANYVNNQTARQRAELLIGKIEAYRAAQGEYPARLEALVPGYIDAVPMSKYTLVHNRFFYIKGRSNVLLGYVHFPPFGRRIYSFETKKWEYLD